MYIYIYIYCIYVARWRQKEVHDILVECAQFSLDLTEGSTAEMSFPGMQKTPEQSRSASKCKNIFLANV